MTDQARSFDLAALDVLRARLSGDGDAYDAAAATLHEQPGRAAGRVAAWSLARAADMLASQARRPVRLGAIGGPPTPPESQMLSIITALSRGDLHTARRRAEFLVRPAGVDPLLERLSPAAKLLSPARRAAA
ncbi:MAG: hypothetical protein ACLFQ5_07725 [Oceanicaulis sp.]